MAIILIILNEVRKVHLGLLAGARISSDEND